MSMKIHRAKDRGVADHGWLKSAFSYSFAEYFDPSRMGFGVLRVVNDDIIAPSTGFPMHPHNNMEIVTIVTEGSVAHKDTMGNGTVIKAGEVQRMSAGKGLMHSEYNPSATETLKLFQIWIRTRDKGIEPEYDQREFELGKNRLVTLVSGDAADGGLVFRQDAWIHRGVFSKGQDFEYELRKKGNGVFLMPVEGVIAVAGETLNRRDEATFTAYDTVKFKAETDADVLLMEVPDK
ncbi:pirin family protein [Seleniivibrio sp.]|uniref:pirin family protein n=1 Tax=Seleniivibrio sp. TaxID=2898801 RepID=UPI0025F1707A|nr:pirin family protein [Seleniivibrio sp.]MCD8554521.1 pirin family protein [Seleniivibrio sp.]